MAQRERVVEAEDPDPVELRLDSPPVRCQVCGAEHRAEDPILCRRCGEPVLIVGWAP